MSVRYTKTDALYYLRIHQYLERVRLLIGILTLLLTAVVPAAVRGDTECCPCPSPESKAAAPAAPDTPKDTPKTTQGGRVASHPIAGGKTSAQAAPIEFERIYKINHPIKKGSKTYFSLPLEPGTELTLAVKSMKKADVGLEILDAKDQPAASLALSGEVNEVKRVSWKPLKTGRYTIAIGSGTQNVGVNQVIFKALLAPATIECAANGGEGGIVTPDTPRDDCFWNDNGKDTFHFDGKKKDVYRIEVVSPEVATGLKATVGLKQKKKSPLVLADVSGSGGRVAIESVVLPKKGTYSVEVSLLQPTSDILPYTLTVTKISGKN